MLILKNFVTSTFCVATYYVLWDSELDAVTRAALKATQEGVTPELKKRDS